MWYLNYNNGLRDVCRLMYGERFHTMNAQTVNLTRYEYNDTVCFVSYETPIACISLKPFGNEYVLYICDSFNCSASTIRQFSRWLRENRFPDYHTVKAFMLGSAIGNFEVHGNFTLIHADSDLNGLF